MNIMFEEDHFIITIKDFILAISVSRKGKRGPSKNIVEQICTLIDEYRLLSARAIGRTICAHHLTIAINLRDNGILLKCLNMCHPI